MNCYTNCTISFSNYISSIFRNSNFELEYFVIADEETLKEAHAINEDKKYRAFIVAYADTVRLIDNMHLG